MSRMEHHTILYVCILMFLNFNGSWLTCEARVMPPFTLVDDANNGVENQELTVNVTEGCLAVTVGNRIKGGDKARLSLDMLVSGYTGLLYNAGSATAGAKAFMTKGDHLLTWSHKITDRTHDLRVLVDGRRVKFIKTTERKMWHTSYDFGQVNILKSGPVSFDYCPFPDIGT